jgi:hypothetical protein
LLQELAKENNYELAELDLKRIQSRLNEFQERSEMIGMSSPGLLIKKA